MIERELRSVTCEETLEADMGGKRPKKKGGGLKWC
jgi:hypothetical protein